VPSGARVARRADRAVLAAKRHVTPMPLGLSIYEPPQGAHPMSAPYWADTSKPPWAAGAGRQEVANGVTGPTSPPISMPAKMSIHEVGPSSTVAQLAEIGAADRRRHHQRLDRKDLLPEAAGAGVPPRRSWRPPGLGMIQRPSGRITADRGGAAGPAHPARWRRSEGR